MKNVLMIHCQNELEDYTEYSISEGKSLVKTLGYDVTHTCVFNIRNISPATYINNGHVQKVRDALSESHFEFIFWNHVLNHRNHRNLEKELGVPIYDRTRVILDIFRARAHSSEEKLQIELAYKEYERSKITHAWNHLERQRGSTGTVGGPGEKQLELDRRMIEDKIKVYKRKLAKIRLDRANQRKHRLSTPMVAIVGYTNVGKTTLFNRITHSHDLAENKLFATLAPHVRRIFHKGTDPALNKSILFSDTVGFIRDFPTSLRNAFAATLEEIKYADLILHVRDVQMPFEDRYSSRVLETLREIGVYDTPIWTVWNKWDLTPEHEKSDPNAFYISGRDGAGVDDLLNKVMDFFRDKPVEYVADDMVDADFKEEMISEENEA